LLLTYLLTNKRQNVSKSTIQNLEPSATNVTATYAPAVAPVGYVFELFISKSIQMGCGGALVWSYSSASSYSAAGIRI